MLKTGISEGLAPHEFLPPVRFHKSVNGPVNLLLEKERVL
jgi:hypothetical protein